MGTWGSWSWGDAATFIALFAFIRVVFIWLATKAFIAMIPDGDRCTICEGATLPIERSGWWRVLGPQFRRSWCLECGWEGVLRRGVFPVFGSSQAGDAMTNSRSHSGQLPLISKKSSK